MIWEQFLTAKKLETLGHHLNQDKCACCKHYIFKIRGTYLITLIACILEKKLNIYDIKISFAYDIVHNDDAFCIHN